MYKVWNYRRPGGHELAAELSKAGLKEIHGEGVWMWSLADVEEWLKKKGLYEEWCKWKPYASVGYRLKYNDGWDIDYKREPHEPGVLAITVAAFLWGGDPDPN